MASTLAFRNHNDGALPRWCLRDVPEAHSAVIYVKSSLAGAGAFLRYAMLFNLIAIPVMMHRHPSQMPKPLLVPPTASDSSVGFYTNTNWVVYSTPVWPPLSPGITVFAGAFYWMFSLSRRRGASPESE